MWSTFYDTSARRSRRPLQLEMVPVADITLTDFSMPEHDGVWLLEQLNQHPRPIPVISVSGFAESQVPRLAQAPFARKLPKPK